LGSQVKGAPVNDELTDYSDDDGPPPLISISEPRPINHHREDQSPLHYNALGPGVSSSSGTNAVDDELDEKVRTLVECFGVEASEARTALLRSDRGMID